MVSGKEVTVGVKGQREALCGQGHSVSQLQWTQEPAPDGTPPPPQTHTRGHVKLGRSEHVWWGVST